MDWIRHIRRQHQHQHFHNRLIVWKPKGPLVHHLRNQTDTNLAYLPSLEILHASILKILKFVFKLYKKFMLDCAHQYLSKARKVERELG